MSVSKIRNIGIALIVCAFGSACQFADLREDLGKIEQLVEIDGVIDPAPTSDTPVVVALFSERLARKDLLDVKVVSEQRFSFTAEPGRFAIFAFADLNQDFQYQESEPAGFAGHPVPLSVNQQDRPGSLGISLGRLPKRLVGTPEVEEAGRDFPKLWAGRKNIGSIATLDAQRFDRTHADLGLWQPLRYSLEVGPGVFFMEPYTQTKTPVLFVHGINGSPRDWRLVIDKLDRRRFQPWVFSYASGLPLSANADYLVQAITQLHHRHEFSDMHIVAHSMGGLISMSFVTRYQTARQASIKSITTLATPWGGHDAAQAGIDYAPAVVPVWHDMAPDSAFLSGLRNARASVPPHTLIFGYGGSGLSSAAHDGVVTVASQLDEVRQNQAVKVLGFDVDHTGILADDQVISVVFEALVR